jgi:putative ABC transport system permease protein
MRWRKKKRTAAVEIGDLVRPVARADRFSASDLVSEATSDIGSRPGRLIMTILGTVLGIGSLVATWGFAQTAAGQISSQFNQAASTQVSIEPETASFGENSGALGRIPWDAPERLERLAGVDGAALLSDVQLGEGVTITSVPLNDPSAPSTAVPPVRAVSAELLDVVGGEMQTGRMFDAGHDERGDRVAVLGSRVAEKLNITRVDSQPSIFIGGTSYAVIGIVGELQTHGDLRDAVIVPTGTARHDFGLVAPGQAIAHIAVGAGPQIAKQAPLALASDDPDSLKVRAPQAGSTLGAAVQGDVNVVFLIVGAVSLLAGGLGIANVTLLSVTERTGEIGLRRALGATRRQIASQFTVESIVIGVLGGLIGAALGVIAVVVVGALVGWISGWYPARRASLIEPITALRAGG